MEAQNIKVGDIVTLIDTATYYDGRVIPEWIKREQWIVKNVNADRVVIDRDVTGTHAICCPVHTKCLEKVD